MPRYICPLCATFAGFPRTTATRPDLFSAPAVLGAGELRAARGGMHRLRVAVRGTEYVRRHSPSRGGEFPLGGTNRHTPVGCSFFFTISCSRRPLYILYGSVPSLWRTLYGIFSRVGGSYFVDGKLMMIGWAYKIRYSFWDID